MIEYYQELNDLILNDIKELEINSFGKDLIDIYQANNNIHFYVYYIDKQFAGFISYKEDLDYYEIYNIAVKEDYRRKKIASSLIDKLNQKNCYLDVKEDNIKAIKLYENNNFKLINRRKNYYRDKDALIYERLK